jgi:phytoene dehydrogenase-like protein
MLADGDSAVPAAGMQEIPLQLAARLPAGTIRLGQRALALSATGVDLDDGHLDAAAVVVACEGPAAARLLGLPEPGSKQVGAVYFSAPDAPTSDKLVILNGERGPVLNAAVMTNVAPTYAPAGRHLVVAALPGEVGDDLESVARTTFESWWGPSVADWDVLQVYRIEHGQPTQRTPFSPTAPVRLDDGLFVCGDHRDTASIQGALYSGRRCAAAVLDPSN